MKKLFATLFALSLCTSICACSKTEVVVRDDDTVVNPISEVEQFEFMSSVGTEVGIPEDAQDEEWLLYGMDGSAELLGEVQYTLDGKAITQRVMVTDKTSLDDDEFIQNFTGCYYDWKEVKDVEIMNRSGKAMSCDEAKVVVWLDAVPGIIYCIETTDSSLTVDDLVKIANETFIPAQQDVE